MTKPTKRVEAEKVARKVLAILSGKILIDDNTWTPKIPPGSHKIGIGNRNLLTVAELRALCEELVKRGTK